MDLRTRYRRTVLGMGWSLLHPIAMTVILCTMFATVMKLPVLEYGPYVLAGLACWNYILGVSVQGCQSLFQGESYIRQYPAPVAIYPLRTALGAAVHFLLALIVVVGLTWYLHGLGNVPALLSLVPSIFLLLVLGWSLAVLAGFANVYFQDTQHLTEVGFQLLFYLTPIIYPDGKLQELRMHWLLNWNPLVAFLRLIRDPILQGHAPTTTTFATASTIVVIAAGLAALVLARLQRRLIFYL
jgi:ABC-type polysaccharide/polyol phosphate export permease